jgi:hypothetical protein
MGGPLPIDSIGSPSRWLLVFNCKATNWFYRLIAMGRYKHVRAFGYVADCDVYVFYDVQPLEGTTIQIARGDAARRLMLEWTIDADVLAVESSVSREIRWPVPFLCTTTIASLIGLRCVALTLRPDALYRHCLRNGATVVHGQAGCATSPARPDAGPAYEDCPATAGAGSPD